MDRTRKAVFTKTSTKSRQPTLNEPQWLQKCELSFARTGKLNLSGLHSVDLSLIRSRATLRELVISKCSIEAIDGLAVQPNIRTFNADNSKLASFRNFASIAAASIFGLKNTPLTATKNYLLALQLIADPENSKRLIIDGKLMPSVYQRRAATYPSFTRDLVNAGWELEFPCPDSDNLCRICEEYDVMYTGEHIPDEPDVMEVTIIADEDDDGLGYLGVIDRLMAAHNDVIIKAARGFDLLLESEDQFRAAVREILEADNVFTIADGEDVDAQIIDAVRALCLQAE